MVRMAGDRTEQQSSKDLERTKDLSLRRARPPAEVPGYELQHFLGSGAYGEVWIGVDTTTRRKVAIKFYLHQSGLDWSLLDRETEKLVFLAADRYVVQLLDVGWDATPPYYVMEYVENGSLDDYLQKSGTLPVSEAVELFREIAVGLQHAHSKGVLHCDIKPANILLDEDHKPRLADFGQSRLSSEQSPALGTLFFMAPEQASLESKPNPRWDVYALGALLYTMLTGKPPYRNDEVVDAIDASGGLPQRLEQYQALLEAAPPISADLALRGMRDRPLAEIVQRCLAHNPIDRYASVEHILDALRVRSRTRLRRPLMVLGVVGPLALLCLMTIFAWRGYQQATDQSTDAIRRRAYESNRFAAFHIARRLEDEIKRYFEVAKQEAREPAFHNSFHKVRGSEPLKQMATLQPKGTAFDTLRSVFSENADRLKLREYLNQRLQFYLRSDQEKGLQPRFASLFALDAAGTIVAVAYDNPSIRSQSVGKNFAYRTYFHGGPNDQANKQIRPPEVSHIESAHLSAAFQSTTTRTWKIGISTPIFEHPDGTGEFAGVLVFTVRIGGFEFLGQEQPQQAGNQPQPLDRFAVLIDGRRGDDAGVILQHPLQTGDSDDPDAPIQDTRQFEVSREQLNRIAKDWNYRYRDPLSAADQSHTQQETWIAAIERVRLSASNTSSPAAGQVTDLIVMVQEKEGGAIDPVRQLGNQLVREAVFALLGMLVTVTLLWFVVLRLTVETRKNKRTLSPIDLPRALPPLATLKTNSTERQDVHARSELTDEGTS